MSPPNMNEKFMRQYICHTLSGMSIVSAAGRQIDHIPGVGVVVARDEHAILQDTTYVAVSDAESEATSERSSGRSRQGGGQ